MKIRKLSYEHTIYASYIGYITQAIDNNFVPLLFLTFSSEYELTFNKITLITTVNFLTQLSVMAAHLFAAAGLSGLAVFPKLFENAYAGIMLSVICYAIGGGIIEVLISPIVEACPTKKKEAAMSLLHSFYCWGHIFVVLVSTVFFQVFGIRTLCVCSVYGDGKSRLWEI